MAGKWDDTGCNAGTVKLQRSPSFTIYVNEGKGSFNHGHVFIELKNGTYDIYRGWYPDHERTGGIKPLLGLAGGEIRDDAATAVNGDWDVKETYPITQEKLALALTTISVWRDRHADWTPFRHCGDFAITVAQSAGLVIELPITLTGYDRPGLFGEYIEKHGGVLNESHQIQKNSVQTPSKTVSPHDQRNPRSTGF